MKRMEMSGKNKKERYVINISKVNYHFISILKLNLAAALFFIAILSVSAAGIIVEDGSLNISNNLLVNTNALYVDSTNNRVGVGTASPSSKLDIAGNVEIKYNGNPRLTLNDTGDSTRAWQFMVSNQVSGDFAIRDGDQNAARLLIDPSGNIGIGTTIPTKLLHVYDGTGISGYGYPAIFEGAPGLGNAYVTIKAANQGYLWFNTTGWDKRSWLVGSETDGINNTFRISTLNSGFVGDRSAKLVIDGNGNVGIGTTSPGNRLHIYRAGTVDPRLRVETDTDAAAEGGIEFYEATTAKALITYRADADELRFYNPVQRITIKSNGNVGINQSTPSVALDVVGDIEYTGTITDVSDIRVKKNITNITNALGKVIRLRGVYYQPNFNQRNETSNARNQVGVIAQEVQMVMPEVVSMTDNTTGYLGVDYTQLVPVLIEAVKEQQKQIENLSNRVAVLEAR